MCFYLDHVPFPISLYLTQYIFVELQEIVFFAQSDPDYKHYSSHFHSPINLPRGHEAVQYQAATFTHSAVLLFVRVPFFL